MVVVLLILLVLLPHISSISFPNQLSHEIISRNSLAIPCPMFEVDPAMPYGMQCFHTAGPWQRKNNLD